MNINGLFFASALFCYLVSLVLYGLHIRLNRPGLIRSGLVFIFLGFLIHSGVMIRGASILIQSGEMHVFEVLVLFSWALVGLALILQSKISLSMLLGFVLVIVITLGSIALGLPRYFPKSIPAINAFWFGTHILTTLLGYAAFGVALLSGVLYLCLNHQLKLKRTGNFFDRLPPLEGLEWVNGRSLWVGIILLGVGLLSGLCWAHVSKVALSVGDPKVIAAWVTWIIYGSILYIRSTARWRGRKIAYLTVLGFCAVMVTFFLMNYLSKDHGFF